MQREPPADHVRRIHQIPAGSDASARIDEHRHTDVGVFPEEGCGLGAEADAAVGGGVAHHGALVKAYAVIREALKVLHAGRVIQIRAVVEVLLLDVEIARRGRFGGTTAANIEAQQHLFTVHEHAALGRQVDNNVFSAELRLQDLLCVGLVESIGLAVGPPAGGGQSLLASGTHELTPGLRQGRTGGDLLGCGLDVLRVAETGLRGHRARARTPSHW